MEEMTIDELMDLDPLEMSKENIDTIIAHYRQRRNAPEQKEAKPDGPKVKINLDAIKASLGVAPKESVRRRI